MDENRPEVLSPVGNAEMLTAALRAGADAVYLGLHEFNARKNAANFSREEFVDAVRACHLRGVRLYLTLNTLLSDAQLSRALETAAFAYEAGADAVIVQDLGLARLIRDRIPGLEMHASTQMSVHTASALPVLKQLGFSQVVLAREMSREEIRTFCREAEKIGMRVEVFVHGALCMSMSGQCYLSAMIGGRSGNRGLCAGPCRLPFAGGRAEYALSLKDLSLVDHLDELAEMGVSSFKIEGRMKRPEYVAAATAVCRKTLDGEECGEWRTALMEVFSRSGFTDGHYTGKRSSEMFGIRQKEDVLLSAPAEKKLHELYRAERQSVELTGTATMKVGEVASLTVSDGTHTVSASGEKVLRAQNAAADDKRIREQLSRTGGTPYSFSLLKLDADHNAFLPASALNCLRRDALEALSEKRMECRRGTVKLPPPEENERRTAGAPVFRARFSSVSQIPEDLSGVDEIAVPLEEKWEGINVPFLVEVPRGIVSEEAVLRRLNEAKAHGVRRALCTTVGALELIRGAGLTPVLDFSMNLFSAAACRTARGLGADEVVASAELRREQIARLPSDQRVGMIAYGRLPLMLTRACPMVQDHACAKCDHRQALKDRMGLTFPVRCRGGYSEVFNAKPIWLADKLSDFPVDVFVLYFTTESAGECRAVIDAYHSGSSAQGEFTRGLYYRGVE